VPNRIGLNHSPTRTAGLPTVPAGLTATAGNGQVSLNWSAISGATSYNVKRATARGGTYTTIASPTTTSYNDTTVSNGTLYYYAVSAVNAVGETVNSGLAGAVRKSLRKSRSQQSLLCSFFKHAKLSL